MSGQTTGAVFLSYSSQDAEAARRIAEALRAAGIEVWFDQSELKGGAAWDAEIRQRIKGCALFVPLISANSEQRREGYFRLEWRLADQRTHMIAEGTPFLVPVVIDNTAEDNAHVPHSFRDVQWTRLSSGKNAAPFAGRIGSLLGAVAPVPATVLSNAAASADASKPAAVRRRVGGRTLLVVAVLLAVSGALLWRLTENGTSAPAAAAAPVIPAAPRTAIAVLPFANLTGDASKEYLGDGMAEELINTLAQVPGLKVPSRTSTFAYKGRNTDIRQIAKDLGVGTILEGSVRAAGQRIRITAQLINAQDGLHLWSQSYDEQFTDIFKLQDKLATQIATALQANLGGLPGDAIPHTAGTTDVEAYNLFLQATSLNNPASSEGAKRAIGFLEQAVQRDPGFARAWSTIAVLHHFLGTQLRSDEEIAAGERIARQALALDPRDGEALRVLAQISGTRRNRVEAESYWRASRETRSEAPYADLLYTNQLAFVGHRGEALAEARANYALAPASANAIAFLAIQLSINGLDSEVARWTAVVRAMSGGIAQPGGRGFTMAEFKVALAERRLDAATDLLARFVAPSEIDRPSLGLLVAAMADPAKLPAAVAVKSRFYPKSAAPKPGSGIAQKWLTASGATCVAAYGFASAGAIDDAYDLADRCLPAVLGLNSGYLWAPETRAFRRDPRFAGYVERLGLHLIEYWQKYGPPDDCALNDGRLTCH